MLPWTPEFQSNQPKNPMQPFPLPDDALHLFDLILYVPSTIFKL